MLLPQPYQYPQLSEGADGVHGQLRGRKEYPFSGVRNQFWQSLEEGDENDARSVGSSILSSSPAVLHSF